MVVSHVGLPNVSFFPFDTLEAQIAKPERWTPTPNDPDPDLPMVLSSLKLSGQSAASHITVPKTTAQVDPLKKIDLSTALQYGQAKGYPPLHSFIRQFARECLHPNVPYMNGPEVLLTCGATDGFSKAVEMIVDPWFSEVHAVEDRPGMLCEKFVYMNAVGTVQPRGVQVVPVEIDGEGMLAYGPGGLEEVLKNWDPRNGRRPHFIYSVT